MEVARGLSPGKEIEGIKSVALRASEIVRELMIYCGQDKATREAVDVSRLVEDTLELLKVSISKHATLQTDLSRDLPPVRGSVSQIRQIVMNLIINASEAIGENDGVIYVATSHLTLDPARNLDSMTLPAGEYLQLEVSDTGCGMPEAIRARIFDPFFSTKFAGRGMGLAVVQGIVRDHGGVITLVSEPGRGTTFTVVLPCDGRAALSDRAPEVEAPIKANLPTVGTFLVVEDEDVLRKAVVALLRRKGLPVIEACDGTDAIDLLRARKEEICAILLDVTLPGVSSRDVFEEARRINSDIRIVLTSAYSKETVDAFLTGLPVEHFIRKPFRLDDLMVLLREDLPATMPPPANRRAAHPSD
jgi:CheY-like chemotaxis protein